VCSTSGLPRNGRNALSTPMRELFPPASRKPVLGEVSRKPMASKAIAISMMCGQVYEKA
jgi:hypothetical protein